MKNCVLTAVNVLIQYLSSANILHLSSPVSRIIRQCLVFLSCFFVSYYSLASSDVHQTALSISEKHQAVVTLDSDHKKLNLSPYLRIFKETAVNPSAEIDSSHAWALNDALSSMASMESLVTRSEPSFGFTYDQRFWGIVTVKADDALTAKQQSWTLRFKDTLIDELILYVLSDKKEDRIIKLGRFHLENQVYRFDRFQTTKLTIEPGEILSIVFMVHSPEPFSLRAQLMDDTVFAESEIMDTAWIGLYFGITASAVFFAILILCFIRERTYFYYIAAIMLINGCCAMYFTGLFTIIMSPDALWWHREVVIYALKLGLFFFSLFAIGILKKEKYFSHVNTLLKALLCLPLFALLCYSFVPYKYQVVVGNVVGSFIALAIFFSAVYLFARGCREVVYFLVALGAHMIGGLVFSLKHWSILPANEFTMNSWLIGSALESVLLSIVICRNFLREKKEKNEAKKQAYLHEQSAKAKDQLLNAEKTMTERLEKEVEQKTKEMIQNLYFDGVTKLFNRTKLLHDLLPDQEPKIAHLAALSLDNFRETYDFWGPAFGDKILLTVSEKLNRHFMAESSGYQVYRLQFDEFAVAATGNVEINVFEEAVQKIKQDICNRSIYIEETPFPIFLSVGISHSRQQMEENILASPEHELLTRAGLALSEAKAKKNTIVSYHNELPILNKIQNNLVWTSKLKDAISENRILTFAQPIITASTQASEKFEVLVRLKEPDGTIVTPYHFMPVACHSNLYPHITRTVTSKACEFFSNFDCEFSINIQMRDIENRDTVEFIKSEAQRFGVSNRMIIEIVESEDLREVPIVQDFITEMRRMGCKIAIDDFGSGYSNFAYVTRIHPDILKIDGSLIKNMHKDKDLLSVVSSICSFSQQLGIQTTAEFVHNETVMNLAKELNIDYLQGFHLGEPQSLEDLTINPIGVGVDVGATVRPMTNDQLGDSGSSRGLS